VIEPTLDRKLQTARPDEKVPIIVTFSGEADLSGFTARNRGVRRSRMIRALKSRYETNLTRSSVKDLLPSTQVDRREAGVRPLWLINGLALKAGPHLIRRIAGKPWVESVRLDQTIQAPPVVTTWDAVPEWNLDAIRARDLWNMGYTGQGVVVACVDTGVDGDHPDLVGRWRGGTNSWFDANDPDFDPVLDSQPYDPIGHGTGVMGIMVGGDAGGTSIGVAPNAQWIAAKIFNSQGVALESEIHAALQWLLDPDGDPETDDSPEIVNNSWGFGNNPDVCVEEVGAVSFHTDVRILRQAGIAVVFSAGNNGPSPYTSQSPANFPESFSVGASNELLEVADFSSRGPSACSGSVYPHVVAPGERASYPYGIKSADVYLGVPNPYAYYAGTSFSAPHAAGAMALLLSAFPSLTPYQLETAITSSAVDLGIAGPDNDYGYGHLDVLGALQAVQGFDAVSIQDLVHDPGLQTLTVVATSTEQPGVTLAAEGLGPLNWKSWLNFYRNTFTGVTLPPQSVTVVSSAGGSDTRTLPPSDTVSIASATYDAAARTFTVVATSSDQPDVNLNAVGFGPLYWKSWLGFYRSTFSGIENHPSSVTVASSGGGSDTLMLPPPDAVSIASATYDAAARTFTVVATSSDQPDVTLSAVGFGPLNWKSWLGFYRSTFSGIGTAPASVTVASSGGGSDTLMLPPPDAVSITSAAYDTAAQTLTVIATSSDQPAVTLTADGLGALEWKSWKNFYRKTFTGIASPPASVTVVSSGGGMDVEAVGSMQ
jgi:bacillopeptidase F